MATHLRDDLEFLYARATRSKDIKFMNQVAVLLSDADWQDMCEDIIGRIVMLDFMHEFPNFSGKFDFLVGDSQMGSRWYRTR